MARAYITAGIGWNFAEFIIDISYAVEVLKCTVGDVLSKKILN